MTDKKTCKTYVKNISLMYNKDTGAFAVRASEEDALWYPWVLVSAKTVTFVDKEYISAQDDKCPSDDNTIKTIEYLTGHVTLPRFDSERACDALMQNPDDYLQRLEAGEFDY